MIAVPIRGKCQVTTDAQRELLVTIDREVDSDSCKSRGPGWMATTRSWKRQGRSLPWSLQRQRGPAHTLIGTSTLQNCGRIHFYCFKPPSLQTLVQMVYIYYLKI